MVDSLRAMEATASQKLSASDLKAEVVCAYVEAGGNIVEVISALAVKGIKAGRVKINSIIRTDPKIREWTEKAFDEFYTKLCGRRLEAVSAVAIQRCTEEGAKLVAETRLRWYREMNRKKPDVEKLKLYADFIRLTDTSLIKQNLIYSRFRDGLHAKQGALFEDKSQKQEFNFPERSLPVGAFDVLRAHVDRLKPANRIATAPVNGQGDNGASA